MVVRVALWAMDLTLNFFFVSVDFDAGLILVLDFLCKVDKMYGLYQFLKPFTAIPSSPILSLSNNNVNIYYFISNLQNRIKTSHCPHTFKTSISARTGLLFFFAKV
jgi:hypothetical protein